MVWPKLLSDKKMIEKLGIGIDMTHISDFGKISYEKNPGLYKKIFQPSEIDYCLKYKESSSHFAGKFALKEAVKKSINENIYISKIITSHKKSKPNIKLLNSKKKYIFRASISHEKDYAIAIVISELIN
jgi:holo-[acyl-carrier protein] synthase